MSDANYLAAGLREMGRNDLMGGKMIYAQAEYACTVGTFSRRDVVNGGGGIIPMMLGDVQVLLADFPNNASFGLGNVVVVRPNIGRERTCKIFSADFSGPMVNLTLHDINEGA